MEDIKIVYHDYEEILLINYFLSTVTKKNNESGSFLIFENKLKINWNNKNQDEIFIKNETNKDEIVTYNIIVEKIYIIHDTWEDTCIIDKNTNFLYREFNKNDNGKFEFENDKLIINWLKWDSEIFLLNDDNIYYYKGKKNMESEIMVYHINWSDYCIINYSDIYRKSNNECGQYKLENNILIILWEKWETEYFYELKNNYYHQKLLKFLNYNNNNYIINFYNNKIYKLFDFYEEDGNINIIENMIEIKSNDINQSFYYNYEENKIIIFTQYIKKIILVKKFELEIIINLLENKFTLNEIKGTFNIKDNKIYIYWDKTEISETYTLNDDKYYYDPFIQINKEDIYLIIKNDIIKYNINIFYDYLYNDFNKISFIQNDNIFYMIQNNLLEKYHLINNFLILDEIYNNFFSKFDINIYKKFNKNLDELKDKEIYLHWVNNIFLSDTIFSIESFLKKNIFFDINGYRNNNYLNMNDVDIILHFVNNRLSKHFYSNNNIEIIFDNILEDELNNELHNKLDNKLDYVFDNKLYNQLYYKSCTNPLYDKFYELLDPVLDNPLLDDELNNKLDNQSLDNQSFDNQSLDNQSLDNQSLDDQSLDNQSLDNQSLDDQSLDDQSLDGTYSDSVLKKYSVEIYNNIIFIINLDDNSNDNIDNILSYLPKNSKIILNIKIENNKTENFFDINLIKNIKNLIITKSFNLINYYILEFINNILSNKKIYSDKIIYINKYYDNFYNDIINIPIKNRSIILFNNQIKKYLYCTEYNYLFNLLKIIINKVDVIKIFIFYYLIKRNLYNLPNNTFLISSQILNKIINNDFSKEMIILF